MWADIRGFSSPYQINKSGTIRHYLKRGFKPGKWIVMKPHKNSYGHMSVQLYRSPCMYTMKETVE